MPFALIAHTRGDELIAPQTKVIAVNGLRGPLELLQKQREDERTSWLAGNHVPWWAECSLISMESIEEVPGV